MTHMQNTVIERFISIIGKKTFSEYADITGIERTRIFRLFNGAEMKISEYEKINNVVAQSRNSERVDEDFIVKVNNVLNSNLQRKWELEIQRKNSLKELLKSA